MINRSRRANLIDDDIIPGALSRQLLNLFERRPIALSLGLLSGDLRHDALLVLLNVGIVTDDVAGHTAQRAADHRTSHGSMDNAAKRRADPSADARAHQRSLAFVRHTGATDAQHQRQERSTKQNTPLTHALR